MTHLSGHAQPRSSSPAMSLAEKAKLLKASPYLGPWHLDQLPFCNKQAVFLTLAGLKPVSETASSHPAFDEASQSLWTAPDDPKAVGEFLSSLGLVYDLFVGERSMRVVVSLDAAKLRRYNECRDARELGVLREVGLLFGCPETAVDAYMQRCCLPAEMQEKVMSDVCSLDHFFPFRMSVTHYEDEMKVVRKWYAVLDKYGLVR